MKQASAVAVASAIGGYLRTAQAAEDDKSRLAVDTHIHAVPTNLSGVKEKPAEVVALYEGPPELMAKRLNKEMRAGNVEYALGMGCVNGPRDDPLGIKSTIEIAKLVPGLKAIGIADPRRHDAGHMKKVEAQIEGHRDLIVAFKAYLGYIHVGPEDPAYRPYYDLAAKYDLPVIVHTGDNWSTTAKVKFAHPLRVDEVAVDYPNVRLVLAHFGNPWLIDAAEVLFKNANVWADLSGLFVGTEQQIDALIKSAQEASAGLMFSDLKKALAYVDNFSKLFYGSDWPLAPMAVYRRLIEGLIPRESREQVFRANALRVFKLAGATPQSK
jgi:predicted TIM-barrel fold metal-dependent hydrolase